MPPRRRSELLTRTEITDRMLIFGERHQAGRLLRIGRSSAYQAVKADTWLTRIVRVGRSIRIPAAEVLACAGSIPARTAGHERRRRDGTGQVDGTRNGKNTVYALHDNHVGALLNQAVYYIEHLRLGITDSPVTAATATS